MQVSQEEWSIFWEVIASVILSKKRSTCIYMYMCSIPNGFRDRAISLYSTLYTVQTSNTLCPHTSCKVHWCWWWNFRKCIIILNKLYEFWRLKNKYWYKKQCVIILSYQETILSRKPFGIAHIIFFLEWPSRILTFPPGTSCITWHGTKISNNLII
jgi:hypothetical protein